MKSIIKVGEEFIERNRDKGDIYPDFTVEDKIREEIKNESKILKTRVRVKIHGEWYFISCSYEHQVLYDKNGKSDIDGIYQSFARFIYDIIVREYNKPLSEYTLSYTKDDNNQTESNRLDNLWS